MKRPSFQFYPSDWKNDMALKSCSLGARGLWIELIMLMHEGSPYGHLRLKGATKNLDEGDVGRLIGGHEGDIKIFMNELRCAGVFSVKKDGTIFCRRMIKDEENRQMRREFGKEGGNPNLISKIDDSGFVYFLHRKNDNLFKIGSSKDPRKILYKVKKQFPSSEITLFYKKFSEKKDEEKDKFHEILGEKSHKEWFEIDQEISENLDECRLKATVKATVKANAKANPTPSSSSSSSIYLSLQKDNKEKISHRPDDVSPEVWSDWLTLMRSKKSAVTQTKIDRARIEAKKAEMSMEEFFREWCFRGSMVLKAEWILQDKKSKIQNDRNKNVISALTRGLVGEGQHVELLTN